MTKDFMSMLSKDITREDFICIDFEFRETDKRDYALICVCAYSDTIQEKFTLINNKDTDSFIKFMQTHRDKIFIGHFLHAEYYSMLSLNREELFELVDSLYCVDTWVESKLLYNTDDKERTPRLSLDALVKKFKIFDYGKMKEDTRKIILTNTTYTEEQLITILNYCMTDCRVNYELYFKLVEEHEKIFGIPVRAMNQIKKAKYVLSQSWGSYNGNHINVDMYSELEKNYFHLKSYLFKQMTETAQSLFEYKGLEPVFKYDKASELASKIETLNSFKWARTESGKYSFTKDYLKKVSTSSEDVNSLREYLSKSRAVNLFKQDLEKLAKEKFEQLEYKIDESFVEKAKIAYNDLKNELKGVLNIKTVKVEELQGVLRSTFLGEESYIKGVLLPKGYVQKIKESLIDNTICKMNKQNQVVVAEELTKKESFKYAIKSDTNCIHSEAGVLKNLTFRSAPRASKFLGLQSAWLRCLHDVPEGWKLCFTDIISEEIILAALISGDQFMLNASSNDYYQYTAFKMGLCSEEVSKLNKDEFMKETGKLRNILKTVALGKNYGATEYGLAMSIYGDMKPESIIKAKKLSESYEKAYKSYFDFFYARQAGKGRPTIYKELAYRYILNPNSAGNFFIQSAGARALIHAVPMVSNYAKIKQGIKLVETVHDSIEVLIKDDENFESNLKFVEESFKEGVFIASLENRHTLLNSRGEVFSKNDIGVETDVFCKGDLVYTKDPETAKSLLKLIKYDKVK